MKEIKFDCHSLGEVITRLRYSNELTMLDFHRACRVHIEIDTDSPVDPTYLHIGGPIPMPDNGNIGKKEKNYRRKKDEDTNQTIGFLRNRN